jgi:hypothetical protein
VESRDIFTGFNENDDRLSPLKGLNLFLYESPYWLKKNVIK